MVARAEYRAGANDRSRQVLFRDQALHQDVACRLGHRVWVGWRRRKRLVHRHPQSLLVHAGGADVHQAFDARRDRRPADVLRPGHIDRVVLPQRTTHADRRREMKHRVDLPHRTRKRVRQPDIAGGSARLPLARAASYRTTAGRARARSGRVPATPDQMGSEKAAGPGDENPHCRFLLAYPALSLAVAPAVGKVSQLGRPCSSHTTA